MDYVQRGSTNLRILTAINNPKIGCAQELNIHKWEVGYSPP